MSEEIFGAVQKLPVNGTKKQVVLQCAPLLIGIKLSNLLNVRADQKEEVFKLFEGSKICCRVLYEFRGRLSILLYRPGMLAAYLEREDVQKLMASFGYGDLELEEILDASRTVIRSTWTEKGASLMRSVLFSDIRRLMWRDSLRRAAEIFCIPDIGKCMETWKMR